MMKKIPAVILGLSLIGTVAEAAEGLGGPPLKMTPDQALQILMGNGFMARKYYNGVPDPVVVRQVDNRARMRAMINAKLNSLVIPKIDQLWDFTMEEAIESLEAAFKKHDPEGVGFQLHINPFVDPGGVPIDSSGTGGGEGGGPDDGMEIDPITGLPIGVGGGMPGMGGGAPQIDPTTGLPIGAGAGGGLPGVGGGMPGMGGGLPGMGGGLPGMGGGIPGMGGGGEAGGAFDPTVVKVRGLKKELLNLTAKQILDIVTMSFDSDIQYIVNDTGIMFLQQRPELAGTMTRMYQLNLNMRSLAMMGVATPQLTAPGGGNGGGNNGGGEGGGEGGYPPGGGGLGGEEGGMMPIEKRATSGGFGSNYRPFNNLNRFAPATGGNQRFNSFTPGYGSSRSRGRQ